MEAASRNQGVSLVPNSPFVGIAGSYCGQLASRSFEALLEFCPGPVPMQIPSVNDSAEVFEGVRKGGVRNARPLNWCTWYSFGEYR